MATDQQLHEWGLERLIDRPQPETEAVIRWRRVLAGEPAAPADPRAEALAQLAANPQLDMAAYAELRQQAGLVEAGSDGQHHAQISRWSR